MNASSENSSSQKRVVLLAGDADRRQLIEDNPLAALVSASQPLRANLSVLENITVVLQFHRNTDIDAANDIAWELLAQAGHSECAGIRDPDLSYEERFVAKLLRVIVITPPVILIDRPAQLLPDTDYPSFINRVLLALENRFEQCWILDYTWNAPLYNSLT